MRNEAETRAGLIDPVLRELGWTGDLVRRERVTGSAHRTAPMGGRYDYLLCLPAPPGKLPLPVAVLEAKKEDEPCTLGLDQAKGYAKRLHVRHVFSSNGHRFMWFDTFTGLTHGPFPLADFPTPQTLRDSFERELKIDLASPFAQSLFQPYHGGELGRRYYQDAAIRAALEKVARGEKRVLLHLATGSGKTYLVCQLLHKLAQAGQITHALFVCDRDELRRQGAAALHNVFGGEVAMVTGADAQKNARILVATYQTLGLESDEWPRPPGRAVSSDEKQQSEPTFLERNYAPDFFSHIIIDECHRSAWGTWSVVLTHNPNAVQIGLTATPRRFLESDDADVQADLSVTANNIRHFGESVYEYTILQGQEDGFLASCDIVRRDVKVEGEETVEVTLADGVKIVKERYMPGQVVKESGPRDANTGMPASAEEVADAYSARVYGQRLMIPARTKAMAEDLFQQLCENGGPLQRTIIFCASDRECDEVAIYLNNLLVLYGDKQTEDYAFKCTAKSDADATDLITKLRKSPRTHFIATTVDLLSTGVDIPRLQNIVFFRYLKSPITFYQMVGRGTRLDVETGKTSFRIYDYTNVTRLFGADFTVKPPEGEVGEGEAPAEPRKPPIVLPGPIPVHITPAGKYVLMERNGRETPVPLEEYEQMIAEEVKRQAGSLDELREQWIARELREPLLEHLPGRRNAALLLRQLHGLLPCDLYDVLGHLTFAADPKTRSQRVTSFDLRNRDWVAAMPAPAAATVHEIVRFFVGDGGIEELDNPLLFRTPSVRTAGGLPALQMLSADPGEVLWTIKQRLLLP